jgi:predicted MFS family arabinose efflux permease
VTVRSGRGSLLAALAALYVAQGVPFGFATEYLPVVLRKANYSMTAMGAVMLLQLPWQLKVFWASTADRPWARKHTRGILLLAQILLGAVISCFAIAPFTDAPFLWFFLTVMAALVASTQDVFVDATAVRSLAVSDRGLGNTAQVAGYRLGMLFGGAWLLLLIGRLGNRGAVLSCGAIVMATAAAAYVMKGDTSKEEHHEKSDLSGTLKTLFGRASWPVLAIALLFKMGIHIVTVPMKAMPVDAKWTTQQIGLAVVIVGTTCGLTGAGVGGWLHGRISERAALVLAAVLQALVCVPLLAAYARGAPIVWTSVSIAVESFASGMGTTVLFAALMSATRRADAGLHYTLLTGANAIALWIGGIAGGAIADRFGKPAAFVVAAAVCLLPIALARNWESARRASAGA